MDPRVMYIPTRIKELDKQIDDILWEETADPRIEQLVDELNYLKEKEANGELYEPNF
jgi:predicted RNA-binding protein with PIN domain